jgi:hypothetical protein
MVRRPWRRDLFERDRDGHPKKVGQSNGIYVDTEIGTAQRFPLIVCSRFTVPNPVRDEQEGCQINLIDSRVPIIDMGAATGKMLVEKVYLGATAKAVYESFAGPATPNRTIPLSNGGSLECARRGSSHACLIKMWITPGSS